jgi:protein TonB
MNPRLIPIAVAVACAHAWALWALQSGLAHPRSEQVEPVVMVVNLMQPPQPDTAPAPDRPPKPTTQPAAKPQAQAATPPAPKPMPRTTPTALPTIAVAIQAEPSAMAAPTASEPAPNAAQTAALASSAPAALSASAAAPAPPAPPQVELPSSSASYLNNAPPRYPMLSKRLGEQGKVVVRALIETDGTAIQASIKISSGHERLDQTALQAVRSWRYLPGKRGGTPEPMWFNIPVNFVLE